MMGFLVKKNALCPLGSQKHPGGNRVERQLVLGGPLTNSFITKWSMSGEVKIAFIIARKEIM